MDTQIDNENKKQGTAFSVRIDEYYENIFNDFLPKDDNGKIEKGAKKKLLERMIFHYICNEEHKEKESILALDSEINLISSDLNNILTIFKNIAQKCQNTVISEKANSEQTIKNLTLQLDTLNANIDNLTTRNNELETANLAFNEIKTKLNSEFKSINDLLLDTNLNLESSQQEIQRLAPFETQVKWLTDELQRKKLELKSIKDITISKDEKITTIEKRLKELDSEKSIKIKDLNDEIKEFKEKLIKELEIDKKQIKLDASMKINEMQVENIKINNIITQKDNEIANLKSELSILKEKNKKNSRTPKKDEK